MIQFTRVYDLRGASGSETRQAGNKGWQFFIQHSFEARNMKLKRNFKLSCSCFFSALVSLLVQAFLYFINFSQVDFAMIYYLIKVDILLDVKKLI